ncbi:DNA translocase FtsK [Pararhizobium sp. LjRoot235]
MAASEIEGRGDAPVWQSAFVLRPNVRFTRTPESAYSKRSTSESRKHAASAYPNVETGTSASATDDAVPTGENPVTTEPPVALAQEEPAATGIQLLSLRLKQEIEMQAEANPVCEAAELGAIDLACFPAGEDSQAQEIWTPVKRPNALYDVSDEVFWSAMDMDADMDVLAPAARWQAPEFQAAPDSVTALYREIVIARAPQAGLLVARPLPAKAPAKLPLRELAEVKSAFSASRAPVEPVDDAKHPLTASRPVPEIRPEIVAKTTDTSIVVDTGDYVFPPVTLLQEPCVQETAIITQEALEQSAGLLESVLEDFGIRGEIIDVRPGPVVTLYEFEPAPGVKSSRVIGLSDDIARSMSALSARVAVVPGRNVIGIELPNPVRETVYFRELIESENYGETRFKLALCLGKTIGGEPVVAELAKMPHLLVAGTTGSGKSVAINTMILSLLYRLKPEECRLIMVDPKMLELSVYDGIPHLLTPVVTDPKKAVMALKWAVREMEDRYRKMSRLGVRNIDGFNARAASARAKGETILCSVQTGFDRSTGAAIFEQEEMDLAPMPYIVVIVDEMADLMMVAGKEIEGAIQRLAQMARAAGIHLIMATQRPSVDVITGTIKANFPTRISFQVTSKIDSRTILGEQGAEHLLGQGDMLHMVGGGRIARVHGPFVSDEEVEKVVAHLKMQGRPEYLGTVTEDAEDADEAAEEDSAVFDKGAMAEEDGNDLYDKAVKVVLRDKKCSTSYIQRRLQIGYNRAASLVERMEREGLVGPANHVGKRTILSAVREPIEVPAGDED